MKIIVTESVDGYNKSGLDTLNIMQACPRMWMKADSALLTHGKPMFKPDFTHEMSAAPYVALRISRMGKSIPARFAFRYYDAVGVAIDFTAEDVLRRLSQEGGPWDAAKSFDGSICIGDWLDLDKMSDSLLSDVSVFMLVDGREKSHVSVANLKVEAGVVIERVSRFFTLRQGDILLMGHPDKKPLIDVDNHIEGVLCRYKLTEFNVK